MYSVVVSLSVLQIAEIPTANAMTKNGQKLPKIGKNSHKLLTMGQHQVGQRVGHTNAKKLFFVNPMPTFNGKNVKLRPIATKNMKHSCTKI